MLGLRVVRAGSAYTDARVMSYNRRTLDSVNLHPGRPLGIRGIVAKVPAILATATTLISLCTCFLTPVNGRGPRGRNGRGLELNLRNVLMTIMSVREACDTIFKQVSFGVQRRLS
jgi:hypothetical protein